MPGLLEPPSKKRKTATGYHQSEWETEWPGIIKPSSLGRSHSFCVPCKKNIKVTASGKYDVKRHVETDTHKQNVVVAKGFKPMNVHFSQKETSTDQVTEAEVLFCHFLAEHNLPAATADHFSSLVGKMFPDSKAAKDFACRRTKATQVIKRSLAPSYTEPVIKRCQTGPFSLLIDESNDKNEAKRLVILVRFFDGHAAKTRLLDMPVVKDGTAKGIFTVVENVVEKNNIPWENMVGFASDNCNVMIGGKNSVLSRLREKNPNIFNIGCICHLVNLAVKSGCKKLTIDIDQLLIDIYYFFHHSSKRREEYKEFQLFTEVDELDVLKHCPTRWLSLEKVVKRTLNQLPALKSYFTSHTDVEQKGKVKSINDRLTNPLTSLTLHFLEFILPAINHFNTIFQAEESKIGFLSEEMDRLLRKLLVKFVQMKHVKGEDLLKVDHKDLSLQHDDQHIAVGIETRNFIDKEEVDEKILSIFFADVRGFYSGVVDKMVKKFPFKNPILPDLKMLDIDKRENLDYSAILNLGSKFCPSIDQEALKEEWEDFQLLGEEEIPNKNGKPLDVAWGEILKLKTSFDSPRFPLMGKLVAFLLCLPNSNAECERAFSMVRKIHTEFRKSMAPETLTAFLQMKINCENDCYDVKPDKKMLQSAKMATADYNKDHM